MKAGGGRAKGHGFERVIAKELGNWWWGKPFRRTPSSGGWDKIVNDGEILAPGDIHAAPEAFWPFSVECKNQQGWDLITLFSAIRTQHLILTWFEQCWDDAKRVDKVPMLIFKKNNVRPLMLLACHHTADWQYFRINLCDDKLWFHAADWGMWFFRTWIDSRQVVLLSLHDFLRYFTPDEFGAYRMERNERSGTAKV